MSAIMINRFYSIIIYTIYNEKYFQKVFVCVIMHPTGQNGRAVCKKHGNHGDARGRASHRSHIARIER